jgi:hypothetical protein
VDPKFWGFPARGKFLQLGNWSSIDDLEDRPAIW